MSPVGPHLDPTEEQAPNWMRRVLGNPLWFRTLKCKKELEGFGKTSTGWIFVLMDLNRKEKKFSKLFLSLKWGRICWIVWHKAYHNVFLVKINKFCRKTWTEFVSLHLVEHCFPICSLHSLGKDQYLFFLPSFKFISQISIWNILLNTRYLLYKGN